MTERLPPHSLEAERALLGSILLDNSLIETITLDESDFYRDSHRLIYRTAKTLIRSGVEADYVTLRSALGDHIDAAGGIAYISTLADGVPRSSSIRHYAAAIRALSRRRRFIAAATQLTEGAYNGHDDAELAKLATDLQDVAERAEAPALNALDFDAMLSAPKQEVPWIVEGWLARRDICMVAAEWGSGKSWLALDLAVSLASGRPLLGMIPMRGPTQRVLYVDEENGPILATRRVQQIARPSQLSGLAIRYLTDNIINLDRPDERRRIVSAAREFRAHWIIFDSLVRFHGRNENDNSSMADFHRSALLPIAIETGAGLIMLHHMSKPTKERPADDARHRARGATDIPAGCFEFWAITLLPGRRFRLTHEKCRWGREQAPIEFEIRDVPECDGIELVGSDAQQVTGDVVLDVLRESQLTGILRSDLMAEITARGVDIADRTLRHALAALCRANTVRRAPEGKAARYWLDMYAPEHASGKPTRGGSEA